MFRGPPGTVLYIGARVPGLHCLSELKAAGHEITILEAWYVNVEMLRQQQDIDHLICGDVRELDSLRLPHDYYDYVFWYQGPEHILERELPSTLVGLEKVCGSLIVLSVPWGVYEQGAIHGNPYEVHLSHLDEPLFRGLGYETATFGQKDVRGSELLAWKKVS